MKSKRRGGTDQTDDVRNKRQKRDDQNASFDPVTSEAEEETRDVDWGDKDHYYPCVNRDCPNDNQCQQRIGYELPAYRCEQCLIASYCSPACREADATGHQSVCLRNRFSDADRARLEEGQQQLTTIRKRFDEIMDKKDADEIFKLHSRSVNLTLSMVESLINAPPERYANALARSAAFEARLRFLTDPLVPNQIYRIHEANPDMDVNLLAARFWNVKRFLDVFGAFAPYIEWIQHLIVQDEFLDSMFDLAANEEDDVFDMFSPDIAERQPTIVHDVKVIRESLTVDGFVAMATNTTGPQPFSMWFENVTVPALPPLPTRAEISEKTRKCYDAIGNTIHSGIQKCAPVKEAFKKHLDAAAEKITELAKTPDKAARVKTFIANQVHVGGIIQGATNVAHDLLLADGTIVVADSLFWAYSNATAAAVVGGGVGALVGVAGGYKRGARGKVLAVHAAVGGVAGAVMGSAFGPGERLEVVPADGDYLSGVCGQIANKTTLTFSETLHEMAQTNVKSVTVCASLNDVPMLDNAGQYVVKLIPGASSILYTMSRKGVIQFCSKIATPTLLERIIASTTGLTIASLVTASNAALQAGMKFTTEYLTQVILSNVFVAGRIGMNYFRYASQLCLNAALIKAADEREVVTTIQKGIGDMIAKGLAAQTGNKVWDKLPKRLQEKIKDEKMENERGLTLWNMLPAKTKTILIEKEIADLDEQSASFLHYYIENEKKRLDRGLFSVMVRAVATTPTSQLAWYVYILQRAVNAVMPNIGIELVITSPALVMALTGLVLANALTGEVKNYIISSLMAILPAGTHIQPLFDIFGQAPVEYPDLAPDASLTEKAAYWAGYGAFFITQTVTGSVKGLGAVTKLALLILASQHGSRLFDFLLTTIVPTSFKLAKYAGNELSHGDKPDDPFVADLKKNTSYWDTSTNSWNKDAIGTYIVNNKYTLQSVVAPDSRETANYKAEIRKFMKSEERYSNEVWALRSFSLLFGVCAVYNDWVGGSPYVLDEAVRIATGAFAVVVNDYPIHPERWTDKEDDGDDKRVIVPSQTAQQVQIPVPVVPNTTMPAVVTLTIPLPPRKRTHRNQPLRQHLGAGSATPAAERPATTVLEKRKRHSTFNAKNDVLVNVCNSLYLDREASGWQTAPDVLADLMQDVMDAFHGLAKRHVADMLKLTNANVSFEAPPLDEAKAALCDAIGRFDAELFDHNMLYGQRLRPDATQGRDVFERDPNILARFNLVADSIHQQIYQAAHPDMQPEPLSGLHGKKEQMRKLHKQPQQQRETLLSRLTNNLPTFSATAPLSLTKIMTIWSSFVGICAAALPNVTKTEGLTALAERVYKNLPANFEVTKNVDFTTLVPAFQPPPPDVMVFLQSNLLDQFNNIPVAIKTVLGDPARIIHFPGVSNGPHIYDVLKEAVASNNMTKLTESIDNLVSKKVPGADQLAHFVNTTWNAEAHKLYEAHKPNVVLQTAKAAADKGVDAMVEFYTAGANDLPRLSMRLLSALKDRPTEIWFHDAIVGVLTKPLLEASRSTVFESVTPHFTRFLRAVATPTNVVLLLGAVATAVGYYMGNEFFVSVAERIASAIANHPYQAAFVVLSRLGPYLATAMTSLVPEDRDETDLNYSLKSSQKDAEHITELDKIARQYRLSNTAESLYWAMMSASPVTTNPLNIFINMAYVESATYVSSALVARLFEQHTNPNETPSGWKSILKGGVEILPYLALPLFINQPMQLSVPLTVANMARRYLVDYDPGLVFVSSLCTTFYFNKASWAETGLTALMGAGQMAVTRLSRRLLQQRQQPRKLDGRYTDTFPAPGPDDLDEDDIRMLDAANVPIIRLDSYDYDDVIDALSARWHCLPDDPDLQRLALAVFAFKAL